MQNIDEPVHVLEYESLWPELYLAERARVAGALVIHAQFMEHIGSTAVPGLASKPIIDIMLGVSGWPPTQTIEEKISHLGYESLGEAGVPERLYFRLRSSTNFNLHVVRLHGNHWRSNIALREYLRGSESARLRYQQAKRAAIMAGANTLLAYSQAKSDIIAALLQEALAHQNAS